MTYRARCLVIRSAGYRWCLPFYCNVAFFHFILDTQLVGLDMPYFAESLSRGYGFATLASVHTETFIVMPTSCNTFLNPSAWLAACTRH